MRWSFRIGTLHDVKIEIHALFGLTLLVAALDGWWRLGGLLGAAWGLLTISLLFICVLIHEIAHVQQALAAGVTVKRISLLPLGGVAELASLPDDPRVELKIAIAGPLSNLALALMFGGLAMVALQVSLLNLTFIDIIAAATTPTFRGLLFYLVVTNVGLAVLNMIPVFPLDGGRVLRSVLALVMPNRLATGATVWLGGLAAFVAGWYAFASRSDAPFSASLGLAVLALIFLGGSGQASLQLYMRERLAHQTAKDALRGNTWVVSPGDKLRRLETSPVFSAQPVVPVVAGERLIGVLSHADLTAALARSGLTHVAHAMRAQYPRLSSNASLWSARQLLLNTQCKLLPIVEGGRLLGMLSLKDIERTRYARAKADTGPATALIPLK